MKRRIRAIFLLMSACILAINGFQAYWLYTVYRQSREQFARTVREALFTTVEKQQLAEAQRLFRSHGSEAPRRVMFRRFDTSEGELPDQIVISRNLRSHLDTFTTGSPERQRVVSLNLHEDVRLRTPNREAADTLARKLSRMLVFNWADSAGVSLVRLDSAYRQELQVRGVKAEFNLDTVALPAAANGLRVMRFNSNDPVRTGYALQTPPVALNPVQGRFVQAFFKTPTTYLLQQMGWPLGSSLVLLALTTGCFLYMLSTILRQKKLSEVKNDFINNMTHELKTPLATVSAAVEAMQNFGALADARKTEAYLNISRQELQRLNELVEKVLNTAAEERRELALNLEPVNPAELVIDVVQRHRLSAPKPVAFDVQVPDQGPVRLDRVHMGNVVNNLIDNAIKYSGETVNVEIAARRNGEGWELTVRDDGIGIPKAYQADVFDRFFRVPTGNLHPVKGFGLGLYYVRQVVQRHGGTIAVRSEPGRGSAFTIWIPET
jgi:signal transduction histidine kinase